MTQEIAKREGIILIGSGYDYWVEALREINSKFSLYETDLKFAQRLLRVPMEMRLDWLGGLIPFKGTIEQYQTLLSKLELIRQWTTS